MLSKTYCLISLALVWNSGIVAQDYDGYNDISARDTGYLCSLMEEYKESGKQPDIVNKPAPSDFSKSSYLYSGGDKCWKMRWNPCSPDDLTKTKPCGWYNMEKAPETECQ